jgi:hypothetical protein
MENKTNQNLDLTYAASIENVDFAFFDWLDKQLNLSCNSKDGFKKVPVVWVTPERAFQVKQNKEFRDINGTINIPLITLERTNITKDVKNNGVYYTNLPPKNNRHIISKRINQKKTSEFANADYEKQYGLVQFARPRKNQKIVYEFKNMLLPVYATFTYNITLFTQYQQQMNELIQPFISRTGSTKYFIIERDGYKYECFIEGSIDSKNNVANMDEEERRYISTITIKTLANLISDGVNQEEPVIKVFENAVELKIPRENIILEPRKETKELVPPLGGTFGTQVSSNVALKKVFTIGNGSSETIYTVQHNLNTRDMYVSVRENFSPYSIVSVGIEYVNLNRIDLDVGDPIEADAYVVTIIG